jgi:hypothetical protein
MARRLSLDEKIEVPVMPEWNSITSFAVLRKVVGAAAGGCINVSAILGTKLGN